MPMFIDQSIESFETWRDLQHDRPEPDSEAPDEHIKRSFTHDNPDDTTMTYTRTGEHDYHFYLYCYDKDAQRAHAREKAAPVRDRKPKPKKNHEMER